MKQLVGAYNMLQSKRRITESEVIRFALWARFDPRLGELLVTKLFRIWQKLDVMKLRRLNFSSPWPQVLAVIFEHVEALIKSSDPAAIEFFRHFKALITIGIQPVSYQSFTIGIFRPAGRNLIERAERSHPFFAKWGFYESEPLFNKAMARTFSTIMDRTTREHILRSLLLNNREITVGEYMEACRFAIQRRQAERDLQKFFKLKKRGRTRNARYSLQK